MKFLSRIILALFSNLLALLIAKTFITGFFLTGNPKELFIVVAIFTAINLFIRPILKLLLGPVILLTFGIGILVVNALMLSLLDYLSKNVTIQGLEALAYATLIISAVNLAIGGSARKTYGD